MTARQLTQRAQPETFAPMTGAGASGVARRVMAAGLVTLVLAGCVTVNAPSEPIVIELNVNIRQEVIYRLAADAGDTVKDNADIF